MANVGIVIISHSIQIAEGVKTIIQQMVHDVTVETAGGTEDGHIGTSINKITAAIDRADKQDGVLIFYDLGSAKMNAEVVLEMASRDDWRIMDTPIVESAYVAAVEASMDKTLQEIIASLETGFPPSNM